MRSLFLALVATNALFLAWARWVDPPRGAPPQDAMAKLPRLMLVSEAPPAPKPSSSSAQQMALHDEPVPGCTSVGPFNDMPSAARTAAMLIDRGFAPQQRAEEGETVEGYWVYVGGMQTDDEVARVVDKLDKSGFTDARVMKDSSQGRRVSVGLFSKRERAERRALAVKHMGLDPEIAERKFPGTVYWVDVKLRDRAQQLPAEVLVVDAGDASLSTRSCPADASNSDSAPVLPPSQQARQNEDALPPRTKVASAPPSTH